MDNCYIIAKIIFPFSICQYPPRMYSIHIISRLMADTEYDFPYLLNVCQYH